MTRPIDIHEDAIVEVFELVDDGHSADCAYRLAAANHLASRGMSVTVERLRQLTAMWCAIAGIQAP